MRTQHGFLNVFLVVVFFLASASLWGQVNTGTIQGTAKDEQGAVVPGVRISVKNVGTGQSRALTTDADGRYVAPNLELGAYEVRAEMSGFQTAVRSGITLTLGAVVMVDLTLSVGQVSQQVEVSGEAPVVETSQSNVAALVSSTQISELPLNGRSYTELATLQEGIVAHRSLGGTSTGYGQQLSFAGSRPDANAYLLDGADINNVYNKVPASASGGIIGMESVREFQVLTNTYSAQFGKSMGGQLNAVTKSGTNQIHGSAYEFVRNDNMDATTRFTEKPNLTRNQFGASLGGPIKKEAAFFFGNYEGFRQREGISSVSDVPDLNARQGVLPGVAPFQVHPESQRFLNNHDLIPLPDPGYVPNSSGTAIATFNATQSTNENYFLVRGDYYFSSNDSLFGRYAHANSDRSTPSQINIGQFIIPSRFATLQESHIFSGQWLNNFRLAFDRSANLSSELPRVEIPRDLWLTDLVQQSYPNEQPSGNFITTGFSIAGGDRFGPRYLTLNIWELGDDVGFTSGGHTLKFGGVYKRIQYNVNGALDMRGAYTFSSLLNFLQGRPSEFRSSTPGSDVFRGVRQNSMGMYIQDDWQVRRGLTLNLGVRYEFFTSPTEVNGKLANLHDILDPEIHVGEPYYENNSMLNLAPRIGFAWDVFGNGRTSLKGGFGVYFDQILYNAYNLPMYRTAPFVKVASVVNPNWPGGYNQIIAATNFDLNLHTVQGDPSTPYMEQWNLSLERELMAETSLRIGYVGSRGIHLGRLIDNVAYSFDTPQGRLVPVELRARRRNSNFAEIRQRTFDGKSWYEGLLLSVRKRMSQGFQMQVSYTFSKALDNASNFIGQGETTQNTQWSIINEDPDFDKGLSAFHVKHNFSFNATYELPFGPGRTFGSGWSGPVEQLLGGWGLNTILKLQTGNPQTLELGFDRAQDARSRGQGTRPDLVAGKSNSPVNGDGRDVIRYFDPAAFAVPAVGFYGNLGRNTLIGPGLATMDLSLSKTAGIHSISENFNIQFRAEAFNILNRTNLGSPSRTVFNSQGNVVAAAGRINTTTTEARQIQLGLKLTW